MRLRPLIVHSPGVLRVPLSRGMFALIDEADVNLVGHVNWTVQTGRNTLYAVRRDLSVRGGKARMHRVIFGAEDGVEIDHIDNNGLNNRRGNLRPATRSQNASNARMHRDNRTGYRGVTRHECGAWVAMAHNQKGRQTYLGLYDTPEEAARAYDAYVVTTRGEFARPNFAVVDHVSTEP